MSAPYSMPVPKTKKARSLKSRLDEAISKFRSQVPLWPEIRFDDPKYEEKLENALDLATARKNNKELQYLYRLGKYLSQTPDHLDPQKRNHLVGNFLHDYFCGEEEAIAYLEDVTMHSIFYISSQDRNIILLLKPAPTTPESPPYEPQEPEWVTSEDFVFSPLSQSPSPQHHLSEREMWHAPSNPTTSNKRRHDAVDLEPDEPLFLTRPFDPTLLATSSLLPSGVALTRSTQETHSRSGQVKHRRI